VTEEDVEIAPSVPAVVVVDDDAVTEEDLETAPSVSAVVVVVVVVVDDDDAVTEEDLEIAPSVPAVVVVGGGEGGGDAAAASLAAHLSFRDCFLRLRPGLLRPIFDASSGERVESAA